jgi:hypothetical protein
MTTSIIRNKLHSFIEKADTKELKKIYAFLEEELDQTLDSIWTDEEFVKELEKRSDEIKSGKVKGIQWEEIKKNLQLHN